MAGRQRGLAAFLQPWAAEGSVVISEASGLRQQFPILNWGGAYACTGTYTLLIHDQKSNLFGVQNEIELAILLV